MGDKLFNSAGYILAKDYVEDIMYMQKHGPWKLPLGIGDKFHLFFLNFFLKFSWFSDIYIKYPYDHSPAYDIIINFLKKKKMLSVIIKLNSAFFRDINIYNLRLLGKEKKLVGGTGHDKEKNIALSKAIGELLERAVSGIRDENRDIILSSFNELKERYENVFYPPKYHRFLPQQKNLFKELNSSGDQKIEWVKGFNFMTNEIALIPRGLTSWGYGNKMVLMHPTTSGSAGGFSRDDVIKSSILEYIERDSFFVHWLTQIPPRLILNESLPEDLFLYVKILNDIGINVYILDTTSDIGIFSVCVVVQLNNSNKNAIAVSGGAGVSSRDAIKKALKEAQQCVGTLFVYNRSETKVVDYVPFVSDVGKAKRMAIWQGDEWVGVFKWFISGNVVNYENIKTTSTSGKNDIDTLKDTFARLGNEYTPLIYFPKNKVMNKLGFCVSQSFIPFCFPLFLTEKYGTFDSDRLKQFAKYKGVSDFKLNPYPHPFP